MASDNNQNFKNSFMEYFHFFLQLQNNIMVKIIDHLCVLSTKRGRFQRKFLKMSFQRFVSD